MSPLNSNLIVSPCTSLMYSLLIFSPLLSYLLFSNLLFPISSSLISPLSFPLLNSSLLSTHLSSALFSPLPSSYCLLLLHLYSSFSSILPTESRWAEREPSHCLWSSRRLQRTNFQGITPVRWSPRKSTPTSPSLWL